MKISLFFFLIISSFFLQAQNGITFKALIKDADGNVVSSQSVDFRFSIQFSGGTIFYEEDNTTVTDQNGVVILEIGSGTPTSGNFSSIAWERADVLNVQIDIEQDGSYVDFGNEFINRNPRSFYAERAGEADNVTGLEGISEAGNDGWRLKGREESNYGDIGEQALDFSYSNVNSTTYGATGSFATAMGSFTEASGSYSTAIGLETIASNFVSMSMGFQTTASEDYATAMGLQTIASGLSATAMGNNTQASGQSSVAIGFSVQATGDSSMAMGRQTTASGFSSTAFGRESIALGDTSTAMGIETIASGDYSTAFGESTTASGLGSIAMGSGTEASEFYATSTGQNTVASGLASTAMGLGTQAEASSVTALGSYNIGGGNAILNNLTDPLFEVGNGTSTTDRSNALTILKNGNTGIGTHTPQERLHIANGRLRIGSETIEDTGSNQLSFNASLLPDGDNVMRLGNADNRWIGVWAVDGTINTSDRREKENIRPIQYGLSEVLAMSPVSFNWKNGNNPDLKLGLIAQDLQVLVPEVVKSCIWEKDETTGEIKQVALNRLGVYYSDLVPVLIKAIQEQQEQINTLKSTIQNKETMLKHQELINSQQSSLLETLMSRVNALEQTNNK